MLEGVWIIVGTAKISAKQNGNSIVEIHNFFYPRQDNENFNYLSGEI